MKRELVVKKCKKCGALVRVIEDCKCENCGIVCCNDQMEVLIPNTESASQEAHLPTYDVDGSEIHIKVNHAMSKEHYIKWIAMITDDEEYIKELYPEQEAECIFPYKPGAKIYAYCNKHDLWMVEVK